MTTHAIYFRNTPKEQVIDYVAAFISALKDLNIGPKTNKAIGEWTKKGGLLDQLDTAQTGSQIKDILLGYNQNERAPLNFHETLSSFSHKFLACYIEGCLAEDKNEDKAQDLLKIVRDIHQAGLLYLNTPRGTKQNMTTFDHETNKFLEAEYPNSFSDIVFSTTDSAALGSNGIQQFSLFFDDAPSQDTARIEKLTQYANTKLGMGEHLCEMVEMPDGSVRIASTPKLAKAFIKATDMQEYECGLSGIAPASTPYLIIPRTTSKPK